MPRFRWPYAISSLILVTIAAALSYGFVDRPVALACRGLDRRIVDVFEWITAFGVSTGYLIGFFALYILFRFVVRRRRAARQALFLFVSTAAAGLAADVVKFVAGCARPKLYFEQDLYGMEFFRVSHEYTSFPSGHAATIFAAATALALIFPKWRPPLILFAAIVAASRVVIGAHYLGDVLVGAYIGVITVYLVVWGERWRARRRPAGPA